MGMFRRWSPLPLEKGIRNRSWLSQIRLGFILHFSRSGILEMSGVGLQRSDVTQATVSIHRRKLKALTQPQKIIQWASLFLHSTFVSQWKRRCSLWAASPLPVTMKYSFSLLHSLLTTYLWVFDYCKCNTRQVICWAGLWSRVSHGLPRAADCCSVLPIWTRTLSAHVTFHQHHHHHHHHPSLSFTLSPDSRISPPDWNDFFFSSAFTY